MEEKSAAPSLGLANILGLVRGGGGEVGGALVRARVGCLSLQRSAPVAFTALPALTGFALSKPPPPNSISPTNTIPPQILYPPWLNKRFAKYYTPFSSHTSKRNTNRFGIRSQHHCTAAHLKKAVIVVCLFTLETLLEAWATAAEGAAPAPSAPVTHTSAKAAHTHPQRLKYHTPPQIVYLPK